MSAVENGTPAFDPDQVRAKYRLERERRAASYDYRGAPDPQAAEDFSLPDDPFAAPGFTRPAKHGQVDAVVLGSGLAGLHAAISLRKAGLESVCLVDRAADVGGTWYWNRYPGAQCDVESYIYLPYLEELQYVPTERYAHQPEILGYLKKLAEHFDLYRDALFQTELTGAEWDERAAAWTVTTDRGDQLRARYLIVAPGGLQKPKLPAVKGLKNFAGPVFHTSRWDYGYTGQDLEHLAGKRIGIIGTGATSLQVTPHLGAAAGRLYVFQRTPSSVWWRDNAPTSPEWRRQLRSGWQEERLANFDTIIQGTDPGTNLVDDGWTHSYCRISTAPDAAKESTDYEVMEEVRARVAAVVKDPATAEALKPYYRYMCKRPCFHDEYLETFNRDNVFLVDTAGQGIGEIDETGAWVGERHYQLDCLVLATGFDVDSRYTDRNDFDIIGRGGTKLSDQWASGLRTFHGLQANGFPNCFFLGFTQTGTTVNYNSMMYQQSRHVGYLVEQCETRGAVTEASPEAVEDWVGQIREGMLQRSAFFAECTPGYYNSGGDPKNPNGFLSGRYPGGAPAFFRLLEQWRQRGTLEGVNLIPRGQSAAGRQ